MERFSIASPAFSKVFLRNTKTLLAHRPTNQRHLSKLNHVNIQSSIDCVWGNGKIVEKSCNDGNVFKQAEILEELYKLERSSIQFKNTENANIDFFGS